MIFLMVFIILGILGVPYMWLIFKDDHHSVAYGSVSADTPPAAEPKREPAAPPKTVDEATPEPDRAPKAEAPTDAPAPAEPPKPAAETAAVAAPEAAPRDGVEAAPRETPASAATEKPAAEATVEKPKKEEPPPRDLPSEEDIASWAQGSDVATIGTLFEGLPLKRFDAFNTKMRSQEILAQHWQVISESQAPDDNVFDGLPEVGTLRQHYADQELARRRLGALKVAWRELRGKPPGLWQVPDLMVALRRIIDKNIEIDFNDLLHAARDLWRGMTLPVGREQVEILWACLAVVRAGVKK